MPKDIPVNKRFIFEIRYAAGHLYFDRCGQTLQDVENNLVGWVGGITEKNTGHLQRIDKNHTVNFSNIKYDYSVNDADKEELENIVDDISSLWKIIQANLGLEDYIRIGCRFNYLIPAESIEKAEDRLEASELTIAFPEHILQKADKIKNRHVIAVITNGDIEYRIELNAVIRHESIDVSSLLQSDPRLLSKNQREYRLEAMKRAKAYSRDPMYAIQLDVDCAQYEPESIHVVEYIIEREKFVKANLLPILEGL